MMDFESARFKRSLAEAAAWCALQSLVFGSADSDATRRRALREQAKQRMEDAQEAAAVRGLTGLKIRETEQWHRAMELIKQVRDSFRPLQSRLRSADLKPSFALNEFDSNGLWAEAVAEVVSKRAHLVGRISPQDDLAILPSGRLLLYCPEENLACGAAEYSSDGFFDSNNVPPWDLWIDFSERILVSWVPPALIENANLGVEVNPEECIRWAT